jgi:hypothetical protein
MKALRHIAIILCLFAALPATAQDANQVRQVIVSPAQDATEIKLEFHWPVTLENHARVGKDGKSALISLRFNTGYGAVLGKSLMPTWQASSDPAAENIYRDMRLDGEFAAANLRVNFLQRFDYTVRPGPDPRSLLITVSQPGALAKNSAANSTRRPAGSGILAKANEAFTAHNYDRAVALYTKILGEDENQDTAAALEYLGLARERKRQLAHAKAVYSDYLLRYPEGEGHDRVSQRLQALLSIGREPAHRENSDNLRGRQSSPWHVYGSSSYYYRYADISIDRRGDIGFNRSDSYSTQSDLLSRVDVTARKSGTTWGLETRFGGGYLYDFYQDKNVGGRHDNETLLSEMSLEVSHLPSDTVMRAGRQYSSGDGVFGRFDGLRASLAFGDEWQMNMLGGRPVDLISETSVDASERWFYGASVDYSPENSNWDFTMYGVQGIIDGQTDRQAVGGELRYFNGNSSLFTLVDYDTHFQQLNTLMAIGNLTLPTGTQLGLTADYRQSPLLTTRNALIGQQVDSIDKLSQFYSDKEIMQLAEDRTADSQNITLSLTQTLSQDSRLYFTVAQLEYGDTRTSGGVEGWEGTGAEYSYQAQFITANLLQENDSHTLSLRYFDGERTRRTGLGINSRVRLGTHWRIQPRLWVEYRDNIGDGSEQWALRPSIRVQYNWARRHHLEMEYGRDWSAREIPRLGDEDVVGNYFLTSYRVDFN